MKRILIALLLIGTSLAQELPEWMQKLNTDPKAAKDYILEDPLAYAEKQMKDIPGGSYIMGQFNEETVERQTSIHSFQMLEAEVNVLLYRTYVWQLYKDGKDWQAAYMDTLCWKKDWPVSYNQPLVSHYFTHPAFNEYPIVGISEEQAKDFCKWLSGLQTKDTPNFRLPTEAEWEYAALGGLKDSCYPWQARGKESIHCLDRKGRLQANFRPAIGDFIMDNFEYTAPGKFYSANDYGLYDMAGNVAEWCEGVYQYEGTPDWSNPCDRPYDLYYKPQNPMQLPVDLSVVKGGGWADNAAGISVSVRHAEVAPRSYIGFRLAKIVKEDS